MAVISKEQLEEAQSKAKNALSKLASFRERAEQEMRYVKQSVEVGISAFGTSWAVGYWGGAEQKVTIAGVPLGLLLFGGLKVGGFSGMAGSYGEDLHNFSDGALASWLGQKGLQLGQEAAKTGKILPQETRGLPQSTGSGFTPTTQAIQDAINSLRGPAARTHRPRFFGCVAAAKETTPHGRKPRHEHPFGRHAERRQQRR